MSLTSFPEELLERILALCLTPRTPTVPRPYWHVSPSPSPSHSTSRLPAARIRIAPLLVSKSWLRIATPLVYNTIRIHSPANAALLSRTFTTNPHLASNTRQLITSGVWPELAPIIRACNSLESLDITLDASCILEADAYAETAAFCHSLIRLDIRHLVVRKANVYLSQPKPRHVIAGLARAISRWRNLAIAHIDFRLSDDATGTGALLTQSLSEAPSLHTLLTQLPAVWNPSLLRISLNPRLERIILNPLADGESNAELNTLGGAVVGTGLFLMEARKWPRLSELIRAGTNIIRTRAHTMGTVGTTYSGPLLDSSSADDKRKQDQESRRSDTISSRSLREL